MPTEHKILYRKSERQEAPRPFEVLTESGWYNVPHTGTYTVICVGAGGGGAGGYTDSVIKEPAKGQNGRRGTVQQAEIALTKGQAVFYSIGIGGIGGATMVSPMTRNTLMNGSHGGTTTFDNQICAEGGQGGHIATPGNTDTTKVTNSESFWLIDGYNVNEETGARLWNGDGGVGGEILENGFTTDGKPGHDGAIIIVHPAEPLD